MTVTVSGLTIDVATNGSSRRLLSDVSFDLRPGETLAIVGESGSGKTMTALTMMGLVNAWNSASSFAVSGFMELSDSDRTIDFSRASERDYDELRGSHMSMIFQDPWTALNPVTTVGRQLVESVRAHQRVPVSEASRRVIELMERVGIPGASQKFHSYPHQFSGGQLQRIMIAMALAGQPRYLIADEPTTALDVTVQRGILELLDELRQDGLGIVLITHDLSVVAAHSDRIAVMYNGWILESGPSRDVIFSPGHPYTHLLVSSVPTVSVGPGTHLVTKADALAGRLPDGGVGRFDPDQVGDSEVTQVSAGHYVSKRFIGAG